MNRNRQNTKKATTTGITSNKLYPQCQEAERAVIGALLVESTAIHEVYNLLHRDFFYNEALGEIYDTIKTVWENGKQPDMIVVCEELKRRGKLEEVGGFYGISCLASNVASAANLREHAEFIHQSHLKRSVAIVAQQVLKSALDETIDVSDAITDAMSNFEKLASAMEYAGGATHISEAVRKSLESYAERERLRQEGKNIGITTGLRVLDKHLCGFQPKQLIIIGARPAMGKTQLALHMAKYAALSNIPAAFFALEMDATDLADRLILSFGEVQSIPYRGGYLTDPEKSILGHSAGFTERLPIYIDDTPSLTMRQIKARCINLQRKGKCGIVFIDYLGLVDMETGSSNQYLREQKVAIASRQAKMLAKELNIPVVLLSQLNRGIESRISSAKGETDLCPGLADLRESGAIEQDADVVLMLHRPEYYDKNAEKGIGIINIAKQRKGKTGKVRFRYNESFTVFFDEDEEQQDRRPF